MSTTADRTLRDRVQEKVKQLYPWPGFSDPFPPTGWPMHMRTVFREIVVLIQDIPGENWDDLGSDIASHFDEAVKLLVAARDGILKEVKRTGREPRSIDQLESDIQELQQLKTDALASWPWSTDELPPVDREMVKASMDALARGEQGESIDVLIARLKGDSK